MAKKVEILDSIMGSHKTNKILEWIDQNPNERYIYISPLLSEVDSSSRLSTDLKNVSFEYPTQDWGKTKTDDLLEKLNLGANIACTHSLYLGMSEEHLDLIEKFGYIVIIDEEVGVIEAFKQYSVDDLTYLSKTGDISVSEVDGMISWVGEELGKNAKYWQLHNLCKAKAIYATKRSDAMLVTQMPIELFTRAKRVVIMTYMFSGNILDSFLRLKGIEVTPFTEVVPIPVNKAAVRDLIDLRPLDKKLTRLSMSVYGYSAMSKSGLESIANHIRSLGLSVGAKAENTMYTFPKDLSPIEIKSGRRIAPRGFMSYKKISGEESFDGSCWIYSGCRATNKYSYKWFLVHCYDRYPNLSVDTYLSEYGFPVDRNVFATSELLQWVWRSRIRNGKPIVLSIQSQRMHNLFRTWLAKD